MSSSQPFLPSSILSPTHGERKKSRFTYKHLAQLALSSTSCPLRVIAHIDLDAFYAQCEMVRLGLPEDQPLAVQQWQVVVIPAFRIYQADRMCLKARTNCNKLPCKEVWSQSTCYNYRGEGKMSFHYLPTCGYVERGR